MPRAHPIAVILLTLGFCSVSPAATASASAGWEHLSRLNANAAAQDFSAALAAHPADRSLRLGAALARINCQPRTDANLAAARATLLQLQRENANDDTGIAATYYLARLQQLFDQPADRAAAVKVFRTLLAAHPGHPIAELAAPKLAVLLLYEDVPAAVWERRVAEIESLIPRLQTKSAQRDTRLVLADALIRLRTDRARAYPLIRYCLDHDLIVRPPRIAALLLEAAESARVLGRNADAIACYARYVREFPYEASTDEIRRRLARLKAEATP